MTTATEVNRMGTIEEPELVVLRVGPLADSPQTTTPQKGVALTKTRTMNLKRKYNPGDE